MRKSIKYIMVAITASFLIGTGLTTSTQAAPIIESSTTQTININVVASDTSGEPGGPEVPGTPNTGSGWFGNNDLAIYAALGILLVSTVCFFLVYKRTRKSQFGINNGKSRIRGKGSAAIVVVMAFCSVAALGGLKPVDAVDPPVVALDQDVLNYTIPPGESLTLPFTTTVTSGIMSAGYELTAISDNTNNLIKLNITGGNITGETNVPVTPNGDSPMNLYATGNTAANGDTSNYNLKVSTDANLAPGTYTLDITYTAEADRGEFIVYTVEMSWWDPGWGPPPTTHTVGLYGYVANIWFGHSFNWDVYVNNQPITDCDGGNHCTRGNWNGLITGLSGHDKYQIKIMPHNNEPEPGWGNAFGHSEMGCENSFASIDAPLTTMAFAPKPSESTTNASNMFSGTFESCYMLTTPVVIIDTYKLPDTITNLSSFLSGTHAGNKQLTSPIDLSPLSGWFDGNNSITDLSGFLSHTHTNNPQLTSPIDLSPLSGWFDGNNSITNLSIFLNFTYSHNPQLTSPIDLSPLSGWFDGNNSITDITSFIRETHINNSSLAAAIDLSPLSGWFSNNSSVTRAAAFLRETHANNSQLVNPVILPAWSFTKVDNLMYFLSATHAFNTNLTKPIDLAPLSGWFSNNNSVTSLSDFFSSTHISNTSLIAPLDLTKLSGWFGPNRSFDSLSSSSSGAIDPTTFTKWETNVSSIGGFLGYTHSDNPNLVLNGQIILPDWLKTMKDFTIPIGSANGTFRQTFYLSSAKAGDTGEVRFEDGTSLSSIGASSVNRQTYTGRTGITPVNPNWQ